METVYADSLIILNTAVDYLLLLCAGKLCALPLRRGRIALGALWGGVYALLAVLWPQYFALLSVKLFAGALAVVVAFGFERRTPRAVIAFYAASAAFAGAVYAAAGLAGQDVSRGLYVPVSLKMLALSFAVCYAVISLVFRHVGKRAERRLHAIEIELDGRHTAVTALEDTGNELTDPVSGDAAVVVGAEALAPLFDDPAFLSAPDPLDALEAAGTRFRLLPCATAASGRALLLCFRPDGVWVNGKRRDDLVVAVSRNTLAPDGEYQAVL